MRMIGIAQTTREYMQTPEKLDEGEFLWVSCCRHELEACLPEIQLLLAQLGERPLLDFHAQDLLSEQQPSHYDYTSYYDVIVFRRLISYTFPSSIPEENPPSNTFTQSDTSISPFIFSQPVGFIIYDHVLLTVHDETEHRNQFAYKLLDDKNTFIGRVRRTGVHLPFSPDELMLRLVDFLTEGHLDLRRQLTSRLEAWQIALLNDNIPSADWQNLFQARNTLHQLEDLCEDQSATIKAWQESIEAETGSSNAELLAVRARDVLEHIERSRSHVHRLQSALESAIQLHFSATANRTNQIMRTLTVLTAIFLPLNLLTGLFGMNFAGMFLTEYSWGFWLILVLMALNTTLLVRYFSRKKYLN